MKNVKEEIYAIQSEMTDGIGAIEDMMSVIRFQYESIEGREDVELIQSILAVHLRLLEGIYKGFNSLCEKTDQLYLSVKR